jgi:lipopolysaccharide export system permease protein
VLREHVGPLTFALSALTSLLLINYIAKRFGELVGKGLPWSVIATFFGLSVPFTVAMTLPMSVLVATLYAFSRLAAENEITAMKANGVSMVRLLVPVLVAASFISAAMIAFNDQVLPRANHRLRTLQTDIARKKPTFALKEQILNEVSPGRFLRTNHLDEYTGKMREVTIYDLSDNMHRRTIYADSGDMAFAPGGSDLLLRLERGYMLEVPKSEPQQLQRLDFETDLILVEGVANQLDLTTEDSYKSDREMSVCELQNEVSRNEHDRDRARQDLAAALLAASREALTGVPAPPLTPTATPVFSIPGAKAPRSKHLTLGRVYCDAVQALRRLRLPAVALVRPLYAQDTIRPAGDSARGADSARVADSAWVADSARTAAMAQAVPVARPPSTGFAPNPTPFVLSGAIESARVRMVDSRRQVNTYAVELHKKIAISVACTVFVLIGAPIALRFPRGGVGLVIGVSLAIFAIYYVGLIAGEALADRAILTPFWAMWSANILLTLIGLALLSRMGREGATQRGGDVRELLEMVRGIWRVPFRRPHTSGEAS